MATREFFDISPLISKGLAVFPGDTPFEEDFILDLNKGDNLTLSHITSTVHIGSHTDAPSHYLAQGQAIHERPLELYFGPCQVIEVKVPRYSRIRVQDLNVSVEAPRVLFKTGTFPDPNKWNSDFASLSADLVEFLAEKKVRLVGIDTPSIDLFDDKILESHKIVGKHDMAILEGIILDDIKPGLYDLAAFPLKIKGADASPVRAVLFR